MVAGRGDWERGKVHGMARERMRSRFLRTGASMGMGLREASKTDSTQERAVTSEGLYWQEATLRGRGDGWRGRGQRMMRQLPKVLHLIGTIALR